MAIRRVVTGHDENMKSYIVTDGPAGNVRPTRPGHCSTLMWCTDRMPVDITSDEDMGERKLGTAPPANGTRFTVHEIAPHLDYEPNFHRTDTLDYVLVVKGRLLMTLDNEKTELGPGDMVIMRGTAHSWRNVGDETCIVAFVLIDSEKVEVPGLPARV
ncbi:MAG: cupin domain-containing protein [Alphaproteobacteria bacterium]|nr:cupin domain-containing protein [Alphaproteobacteria bacterium]